MGKNIKTLAVVFFVCAISFSQLTKAEVNGKTIKLNNLVSQELSVSHGPKKAYETAYFFDNPRPGWIFIASKSDGPASISFKCINNDEPIIIHDKFSEKTVELMYFLKKAKHRVKIKTHGTCSLSLVVRAIPELQFAQFGYVPWVYNFGPYDPEYLQKHVLKNINCILSNPADNEKNKEHIENWRKQGKRWITNHQGIGDEAFSKLATENAENVDGIIIDELLNSHLKKDVIQQWTDVIARLSDRGKLVYPYYGGVKPEKKLSIQLTKTAIKHKQKIAWEVYLAEKPTIKEAKEYIKEKLADNMRIWEKNIPGSRKNVIIALGAMIMNTAYTTAGDPEVDWKYFIDMQHNLIVNDPAFEGLAGIQHYTSGYIKEEYMRWIGKLNRHYYIEGNTDMLSDRYGFKYKLDHIENPDFKDGLKGWQTKPAQDAAIAAKEYKDYHKLQGRHGTKDKGDTFLWTKRSEKAPNIITQKIKNLKPGKLYSLTLIAGDFDELKAGNSNMTMETGDHEEFIKARIGLKPKAISVKVKNVEILNDKSFIEARPSHFSSNFGEFNRKNRYMFNYHYIVFRAMDTTAQLTISDWLTNNNPGGPPEQELIYNFIEVQPYLPE